MSRVCAGAPSLYQTDSTLKPSSSCRGDTPAARSSLPLVMAAPGGRPYAVKSASTETVTAVPKYRGVAADVSRLVHPESTAAAVVRSTARARVKARAGGGQGDWAAKRHSGWEGEVGREVSGTRPADGWS
jgi:hypothetical protein